MDQIKKWWNLYTNNDNIKDQIKIESLNIEIVDGEYCWKSRTQEQRCTEETSSQYSEEMMKSLFFYLITNSHLTKNFTELIFVMRKIKNIDFFDHNELINKKGQTPMEAVIINNECIFSTMATINSLCIHSFGFDLKNRKGTVLFTALECRNLPILDHLLTRPLYIKNFIYFNTKINIEAINDRWLTVLDIAIDTCIKDNNEKFIDTLLFFGAKLNMHIWVDFENQYIIKENIKTHDLLSRYLKNKDKIINTETYVTYM